MNINDIITIGVVVLKVLGIAFLFFTSLVVFSVAKGASDCSRLEEKWLEEKR